MFEEDTYKVKLASIISNVDKDVVVELYQPFVGAPAIMLYLTLQKQNRNFSNSEVFSIGELIKTTSLLSDEILMARMKLESVGLLRTYEKGNESNKDYVFVLYAPKSPKDFFDDVLFRGLILNSLGEKETKKLASRYKLDISIPEEYSEVSASFVDIYKPDYDDPLFSKEVDVPVLGHDSGRVKINFNHDLFNKHVSDNSLINITSFTKKELKEIERISALYGLDEKQMADLIITNYTSNSKNHVDFDKVANDAKDAIKYHIYDNSKTNKTKINGEGIISDKVRLMDESTPAYFLQILQNNTKPARADLKIVDDLSKGYGFSNGIINVIIDYVLNKNNNILSRNYCEKIASSLARQKVETTLDAMNYLNNAFSNGGKRKTSSNAKATKEKTKPENSVVSDDEMNEIINMLESKKKGGKKDGKI